MDVNYPNCWYNEIKKMKEEYIIDISPEQVESMLKSTWKREIKTKITQYINSNYANNMSTKLRFTRQSKFMKQHYLENLSPHEVKQILRTRLNMVEAKDNFKGIYKTNLICDFCKKEKETTEHLLQCDKIKQLTGINMEKDVPTNMTCMENLKMMSFYITRVEQMKSVIYLLKWTTCRKTVF